MPYHISGVLCQRVTQTLRLSGIVPRAAERGYAGMQAAWHAPVLSCKLLGTHLCVYANVIPANAPLRSTHLSGAASCRRYMRGSGDWFRRRSASARRSASRSCSMET